jgi:hypothetical protein
MIVSQSPCRMPAILNRTRMIAAEFQLTSDDYVEAQVSHSTKILGKR